MNTALQHTILHVTQKPSIEHSSYDDIQKIIEEYPYFAPAQLVYAAKLKKDGSYKLQTQKQKTGLYFNNLRWLQYQLMEVGVEKFTTAIQEQQNIPQQNTVEQVVSNHNEQESVEQENVSSANAKDNIEREETKEIIADIATQQNIFLRNIEIPTVEHVKNIMSGIDEKPEVVAVKQVEKVEDVIENTTVSSNNYDEIIAEESIAIKPLTEQTIVNEPQQTENFEEVPSNNTYAQIEEVIEPVSPTIERQVTTDNDIHAQIAALKANWHKSYTENKVEYENAINSQVVDDKITINENVVEHATDDKKFEIHTEMPNLRADWDKPTETFANEPLPFETEPYYTIDYFASQGIKFDYSKEPQDKLTTKMLKFTDWLKKMKGAKSENIVTDENPELENAIIKIAETSNQSKEVITETMADVFAKQGKKEQAIQLYIKLSFLIPDKTTYFAAKIKELKGI